MDLAKATVRCVGSSPTHNIALLQTFLALFSVTGLVLAAVTSERSAAEQAAHEGEERFRLLVESVQDYAIIRLDPAGRVASWNAGAERIKGYKADEIIGRHFSVFYPPEDVTSDKPGRELAATYEGRIKNTEIWKMRGDPQDPAEIRPESRRKRGRVTARTLHEP